MSDWGNMDRDKDRDREQIELKKKLKKKKKKKEIGNLIPAEELVEGPNGTKIF